MLAYRLNSPMTKGLVQISHLLLRKSFRSRWVSIVLISFGG